MVLSRSRRHSKRPDSADFKHIILNPQPARDATCAKAGYHSIRGEIVSDWKRGAGHFTVKISIPATTTATIFVPAKLAEATEEASGAKFLRMENNLAIFETGPGNYRFESSC